MSIHRVNVDAFTDLGMAYEMHVDWAGASPKGGVVFSQRRSGSQLEVTT